MTVHLVHTMLSRLIKINGKYIFKTLFGPDVKFAFLRYDKIAFNFPYLTLMDFVTLLQLYITLFLFVSLLYKHKVSAIPLRQ